MKVTGLALRFHRTGPPGEVVQCDTLEWAEPGPGEVRVRMLAAPVNPADLNMIEGKYGVQPPLPAVLGNEGVGEVESIGSGVGDLKAGDRVVLASEIGTWAEWAMAPAHLLRRVRADLPVEQAAMVRVNPPTALLMLTRFVTLAPGEWVIQNAANSAVGRSAIAIARARGWRTINVVRRPELVAELEEAGGDVVVSDDSGKLPDFAPLTGGGPVRLALNAVGGESALRLASVLAPGGVVVTYGAMGRQPLKIPNGLLIFKDLRFVGFWLTRWMKAAAADELDLVFAELEELMVRGLIPLPVAARFPLARHHEALEAAACGGRAGKILFEPGTA